MSVFQNTIQNIYPRSSLLVIEGRSSSCGYVDNGPFLLPLQSALIHKMRKTKGTTMNPTEAADLVELASSIWPSVKDTDTTRQAWFLALARTNFYDAMDAIGSLARERKTVHVSDVVKRAERIRLSLVRSLPPVPDPPVELADDPQAEQLWLRTARERQLYNARLHRHNMVSVPVPA